MVNAILDTSFILTCVRQKIDFREEFGLNGISLIIPKQVIGELNGLSKSDSNASLALQLIAKTNFKTIDLHTKNVDNGIISYSKKHENLLVATLDGNLAKQVANSKIIIRQKKKIMVR